MNKNANKDVNSASSYVAFERVTLRYGRETPVLNNCSFTLAKSNDAPQRYALIGESGSGKTTIVNLVLGNVVPQQGRIRFNNRTLCYDEYSLRNHRASIGFISQNLSGLISYLNVLDNVKRPALLEGNSSYEAANLARKALQSVGLDGLRKKTPDQLSGGELQRVLIAKMIVRRPSFMIFDEPTSALDRPNSRRVVDAILNANIPTLIVTHDPALFAPHMDGLFLLEKNGRLHNVTSLKHSAIWNRFNSSSDLIEEVRRFQRSQNQQVSPKEKSNAVDSNVQRISISTNSIQSYAK